MALPQPFIDLVLGDSVAAERTARDFAAMADALNAKTEPGPVPIRELSSYCINSGITGAVLALIEVPIGADGMTLPLKGLLHTVRTLIQADFRLEEAEVTGLVFAAACDGLVTAGVITSGQKAEMVALGNDRRGRAEVILGRPCTASECLEAAGGD